MELKDKLARIRAKRESLDEKARQAEFERQMNIEGLEIEIEAFGKEIEEIVMCSRELLSNNLPIGQRRYSGDDSLTTSGFDGNLGVYVKWIDGRPSQVIGVGIKDGGPDRICVNEDGLIIESPLLLQSYDRISAYRTFCRLATRFINEFADFKKRFDDYIENL